MDRGVEMAGSQRAAVMILANEACLASRGVAPEELIEALAAEVRDLKTALGA